MSWTARDGRRPTILHLVYSVEHGGTERTLCRLVSRLAGDGVRHLVCTQRAPGARAAELPAGVDVVPLHAGGRDRFAFLRLAAVMRRYRPNVIHARNWGTWTDAALAGRLVPHARVVLGFHGLQRGGDFSFAQRLRARLLGLGSYTLTAVSHAGRAQLASALGCRPERIAVLANGVDVSQFAPADEARRRMARARWGLGESDFVIGNVGNFFSPVKGHARLLAAFAALARTDARARLLLVGHGPLQASVREQARRLDLGGRVIFTDRVEDAAGALAALDVYVCPSLSEGLSNALLEAMACGLACVATDVSDHRRMFASIDPHGVAPPGDVPALAHAVARYGADPGRRAAAGAAARELVVREYAFEQTVERYRRFYGELARSEGPAGQIAANAALPEPAP